MRKVIVMVAIMMVIMMGQAFANQLTTLEVTATGLSTQNNMAVAKIQSNRAAIVSAQIEAVKFMQQQTNDFDNNHYQVTGVAVVESIFNVDEKSTTVKVKCSVLYNNK